MTKEMKTFCGYEIVDEQARKNLDSLSKTTSDEFVDVYEQIDKVSAIAKGASVALTFGDYNTMITELNNITDKDVFHTNYNIMIRTLEVPDVWISEIADEYVKYNYTSDGQFIIDLEDGTVQVGYCILSPLETQKVDLHDYVSKSDFDSLANVYVAEYKVTPFADILSAFQNGKLCYLWVDSMNAMLILTHCHSERAIFTRIFADIPGYADNVFGILQGVCVSSNDSWEIYNTNIFTRVQKLIDEQSLQKVSTASLYSQVYGKTVTGKQEMVNYHSSVLGNYLVQRLSSGHIQVPSTPDNDAHATSKKYVDDKFSAIKIPTQKVIRANAAGTLRCQPNTTYMIYCTGDEDATLRGYGSKNESSNDSGGYVNISAKVLSVTCGGVGDTYTDGEGNTISKAWGNTEAEYFATAVQTGTITAVSSIKPRRGVVFDSSDGSQYAEISYPANCSIMINTIITR